ncbi:MAG: CoA pyrophosphatase [Pelomonas sp.]|nr:CoA pyrophosphatase [Roseateles sp.]
MPRPPILDPQAVPVIGTSADLPAVPLERLTPAALRQRFETPPPWQPEFRGDGGLFAEREPAQAAVLVPLVERPEGLSLLLTRRTAHLRAHAGQISFPGGGAEAEDDSPEATALRETREEIGLAAEHIEVLGRLNEYVTVTNFHVTPVVALVRPPFALALDAFEVAEAFEVPLAFLMDPAHHQRHRFEWDGGQREFLSMPWRDYFVWGATAAMLRNLYRLLSA